MAYSSAVLWGGSYGTKVVDGYSITPDWFGKLAPKTTFSYATTSPTPPLSFNLKTSTYGSTIPVFAGSARLPGRVIWARVDQNLEQSTQYGSDGSILTAETYLWSPYADVAFSFGYNAIPDVAATLAKLWFNGVQIGLSTIDYTFYGGTEEQLQDPTILAIEGAANTSAYRGEAYIVIRNLDLSKFGYTYPACSALLNVDSAAFTETLFQSPEDATLESPSTLYQICGVDWTNNRYWIFLYSTVLGEPSEIIEYSLEPVGGAVTIASRTSADPDSSGYAFENSHYVPWIDTFISHERTGLVAWDRNGTELYYNWSIDLAYRDCRSQLLGTDTIVWFLSNLDEYLVAKVISYTAAGGFTELAATGARIDGIQAAWSKTTAEISKYEKATSGFALGTVSGGVAEAWMVLAVEGAGGTTYKDNQLVRLTWDGTTLTTAAVGTPLSIGYAHHISGIHYNASDDSIVVTWIDDDTGTSLDARTGGIAKFTRAGAISYQVNGLPPTLIMHGRKTAAGGRTRWGSFHPNSEIGDNLLFCADGSLPGVLTAGSVPYITRVYMADGSYENFAFSALTDTITDEADYYESVGNVFRTVDSDNRIVASLDYGDGDSVGYVPQIMWSVGLGGSSMGTTLGGSIIGRGTLTRELEASDFTMVNVDDPITGWIVHENADFKSHLQNDSRLFGFSWYENGDGITCVRPVDGDSYTISRTLTEGDLCELDGEPIQIMRGDESEVPSVLNAHYIDETVEYQQSRQRARRARYPVPAVRSNRTAELSTPIILDADEALSAATKALFRADVGRIRLRYRLKQHCLDTVPTDIQQLPALKDGRLFIVEVEEAKLNPDLTTDVMAKVLLENESISLTGFSGSMGSVTNAPPRLLLPGSTRSGNIVATPAVTSA